MSKEEILAEAKVRYPVGTKYIPAHLARTPLNASHVNTIYKDDFKWSVSNIYLESTEHEDNNWADVVYYGTEWAPIVQVDGDKVTLIKDTEYPIF